MQEAALQRNQQQVRAIHDHLMTIRRNMEGLISENRQLRDDLERSAQQVASLTRQNRLLQERDQHQAAQRDQLEQCIDDALKQVERALSQVEREDGEGEA